MQKLIIILAVSLLSYIGKAQNPVGKWKVISHISVYEGQKFDSHKALLELYPCASQIFYEIKTDGAYRLNAASSTCEEKYKKTQEKLHSESVWTVIGNKITIGHKKAPSIGQTYTFTMKQNKMIWIGTDGQGEIVYEKL
jgi:hypothetical protein